MVARVSNTAFASPFDVDPFSMTEEELEGEQLQPIENGLVEEGTLGTAFDLSTTVTDPDTGIRAYQSTIREQDYGEAPVYTDANVALDNYMDFYNRVLAQQEATNRVYNYNQYDPGDFARMGFAGARAVADRAGVDVVQDFLTENEVPLSKEINGQTFYLNTGIGTPESYGARGDGRYVNLGEVGTYSTVFVEDPNVVQSTLSDPIIGLAASFVPFGNLALTGAQLAADVDVNPLQAASGLLQGLQVAGLVRPPSAPLAEGLQGAPDVGEGLFGTTYAQTESLITAASAGNIEEAVMGMFGGQLVNEGLAQAGISPETLGLTQQQLTSGVNTTVNALAQGAELDEALAEGFGRQLVEGVVDAIPTGDAPSLGFIEDAIRPIVEPVIDAVEQIGAPFVEVVEQGLETVEPVVETIVDAASTVGRPIEDVVKEVGSTAEDIVEPLKDTLEDVLSGVDLASMEGINMDGTYRPSAFGIPTQVEKLFGKELFKFETEIGISPEYFEYEEFYDRDLMPIIQQPRIYSF